MNNLNNPIFMPQSFNGVKKFKTVLKNLIFFLPTIIYGCTHTMEAPTTAAAPPTVPVAKVVIANASTFTDYPASIEGKVNLEIRPQVDGYLDKIYVDEGAYVQQGQLLFKIDDRTYREQYHTAVASLHAAEAAVLRAKLDVDKIRPLVTNNVVSDFQLKTAEANYNAAMATQEQAKASVAASAVNLGYTTIKAPVSGYIGRLPKKQGSLVSHADAQELTTLSDVHEVYTYFSLGESDFNQFKNRYPGETLQQKLSQIPDVTLVLSGGEEYSEKGKIEIVNGAFDRNTGAITLRAVFPNASGLLRSGNTGKVRLPLEHNDALLVPQDATVELQDRVFVVTVNDSNKVSRTPIIVSGKSGNNYIVSEGIRAGDRIVTAGMESLQDGMVITPEKAPVASLTK